MSLAQRIPQETLCAASEESATGTDSETPSGTLYDAESRVLLRYVKWKILSVVGGLHWR